MTDSTKEKIVAALDLGSQSFRMVTARCGQGDGQQPKVLARLRKNVRLSEGMEPTGLLSDRAVSRAVSALLEFKAVLDQYERAGQDVSVRAVATEVLRRASNAGRFIDMVRERTGITIEVISWQEEAALASKGAFSSLPELAFPAAMIDVGGGSSEVVIHDGQSVVHSVSMPVGAVTLWEQMGRPDRLSPEALAVMRIGVMDLLAGYRVAEMGPAASSVATGGTATTAAAVALEMEEYDPKRVRGTVLTLRALEQMLEEISSVPVANRYAIKGLEPERADIFPAGLAILIGIAITLGMDEIVVSDGGILLGVLLELLEKECATDAELSRARGLYI